jgi:L-amino acid N-acyltransferase YncA
MATIIAERIGVHGNGERYTEYILDAKPFKIVVQSTTPKTGRRHWYVYEVYIEKDGSVRTLGSAVMRKHAEQIAKEKIAKL